MVAVSRREAYEAAAMGPRGVCLKDQGGAMPLCLSPHRKLTWQWNITFFFRRYIFKWLVFHCCVQFRRCKGVDADETSDEKHDDDTSLHDDATSLNQSVS